LEAWRHSACRWWFLQWCPKNNKVSSNSTSRKGKKGQTTKQMVCIMRRRQEGNNGFQQTSSKRERTNAVQSYSSRTSIQELHENGIITAALPFFSRD
jgi:hypothetical protein